MSAEQNKDKNNVWTNIMILYTRSNYTTSYKLKVDYFNRNFVFRVTLI